MALQLMKESFPYHTRDVYSHETFTRNLLQVVHSMPDLRLQILELLVEKMLQLDVRCHFFFPVVLLVRFINRDAIVLSLFRRDVQSGFVAVAILFQLDRKKSCVTVRSINEDCFCGYMFFKLSE